jgi:predicted aldo/keto reductase-like oxidoreductase
MEQLQQNIQSAASSGVGSLTTEELDVYDRVRAAYEEISPIPCTDCQYCLPCPSGVDIPRVFEIYNDLVMYSDDGRAKWAYNNLLGEGQRGDACTECGECLEKCPQHIEIPEWLEKAHERLGGEG